MKLFIFFYFFSILKTRNTSLLFYKKRSLKIKNLNQEPDAIVIIVLGKKRILNLNISYSDNRKTME